MYIFRGLRAFCVQVSSFFLWVCGWGGGGGFWNFEESELVGADHPHPKQPLAPATTKTAPSISC